MEAAGVGSLEVFVEAGQEQAGEEDAKGRRRAQLPRPKRTRSPKRRARSRSPRRYCCAASSWSNEEGQAMTEPLM